MSCPKGQQKSPFNWQMYIQMEGSHKEKRMKWFKKDVGLNKMEEIFKNPVCLERQYSHCC